MARIVAERRGKQHRRKDQQKPRGKAEPRLFDLLADDPGRLPAKPDDLAGQDRQQDEHRQDALQILVDVGNRDEMAIGIPSGTSQRRKRGTNTPSGKDASAISRT